MSKKKNEQQQQQVEVKKESKLLALKDFKFKHGKDVYEIVKGKEVKVPEMFLQNLKTEKVIK